MLIQSPLVRSAGATKAATARAPVDGAGFSLSLGQGRATAAPSGPIASSALASLGTLLMLQEDVEIGERRRKAVKRGNQLLDHLDELRRAMLTDADPRAARAVVLAANAGGRASGRGRNDDAVDRGCARSG